MIARSSILLCFVLVVFSSLTKAALKPLDSEECPLSLMLGVKSSAKIKDSQLSSSSDYEERYKAKHGRILGRTAWCPGANIVNGKKEGPLPNSWLQVSLLVAHFICGASIQGNAYNTKQFVMYFWFKTSTDGKKWLIEKYMLSGTSSGNKHFSAFPEEPRLAKFVRFYPSSWGWKGWPCMRVELYGKKVFEKRERFIVYHRHFKTYARLWPTMFEKLDKHRHAIVSLDTIVETVLPNGIKKYDFPMAMNRNHVYVDLPPVLGSIGVGADDTLLVLPKHRYLPVRVTQIMSNDLYAVRRADTGRTEVMRRAYLRIPGGLACTLEHRCPSDTVCNEDPYGRPGRYYCLCKPGFVEAMKGAPRLMEGECKDVNECSDPKTKCPAYSKCINTIGSYICACNRGFTGSGVCDDIDECTGSRNPCQKGTTCNNTIGSYHCDDVNECLASPCFEGETCVNSYGSFDCLLPDTDAPQTYVVTTDSPSLKATTPDPSLLEGRGESSSGILQSQSHVIIILVLGSLWMHAQ